MLYNVHLLFRELVTTEPRSTVRMALLCLCGGQGTAAHNNLEFMTDYKKSARPRTLNLIIMEEIQAATTTMLFLLSMRPLVVASVEVVYGCDN